jgi:hypothetical protein
VLVGCAVVRCHGRKRCAWQNGSSVAVTFEMVLQNFMRQKIKVAAIVQCLKAMTKQEMRRARNTSSCHGGWLLHG